MSERLTPGDRDRKTTQSAQSPQGSAQPTLVPVEELPPAPAAPEPKGLVVSWEQARLRQHLPKLVGRCMSFSANPCFDDALVAAVNRFYGVDVDVATAETDILEDDFERVRFFPWFLWDFPLPPHPSESPSTARDPSGGSPTIGSRFLAEAELNDYERSIVRGLVSSTVSFVEVLETHPSTHELIVLDLQRGDRLRVFDQTLATDLLPRQLALVRLVRLDEAASDAADRADTGIRPGLVDAIYAVLPNSMRAAVEDELSRLLDGEPDPLAALKNQGPELLDFAEQLLETLAEPAQRYNADGEPIILCRTVLRGSTANTLMLAAESDATFVREGGVHLWREDERIVGWLRMSDDRLHIEASSRERFDRLARHLGNHTPLPALRAEYELNQAVMGWFARGESDAWLLDPDVRTAFECGLDHWLETWPEAPHPSLHGKSPREIARSPEGRDTLTRLIARLRMVVDPPRTSALDALFDEGTSRSR